MKSQFLIAFNEVCREKNLPPETVLEALSTALISAYRRNSSVSSSQSVTAEVDPRTGEVLIYAEKEVVADEVIDIRTEVTLEDARRANPNVQVGDMVMAESTPRDFGRIAAQAAKQVILQRVREAEREHLFEEFAGREGEIVNGTVQSISGGTITVGLGRTEATLPRAQQISGERFRPHDKIRVYILEVRRATKGPQIVVSRNHRNLLRRLLELEVPEIYNGQVDIKSIAREAGGRSKIAVQAMQPGVDAVGACVGMRGVRIQSIVRELNDEKIDVIPWDNDPRNFIAQALSPARTSQVFLDDDPLNGRTAIVMVPDDMLSLAIGREGQNARLAAKLTGWRIDIKSLTQAARDSIEHIDHPAADPAVVKDIALHERVLTVLEKKDAGRLIGADDYADLSRLVAGVEGRIIAARSTGYEEARKQQIEARRRVPEHFWILDLEELNLPLSLHNRLAENGYNNVGVIALALDLNPRQLLGIDGFDEIALEKVRSRLAGLGEEELSEGGVESGAAEQVDAPDQDELQALVSDAAPVAPAPAEPVETLSDYADDLAEILDLVEPLYVEPEELVDDSKLFVAAVTEAAPLSPLDDLSQSLVTPDEPAPPVREVPAIRVARPSPAGSETETTRPTTTAGKPAPRKKQKKSRQRPGGWSDFDEEVF
jgi:N utilization substance protein A